MKKLLIILLVFAAAGGLFAQELKWSGGVSTGIGLSSDETQKVEIFNDDSWEGNLGFLQAEYTNENVGASIRVQSSYTAGNEPDFGLHSAMVWANLLNDIIQVRAGKINYYLWGKGNNDWNYFTYGTGAMLEVKPIEGLSFGAIFKTNLDKQTVSTDDDGIITKKNDSVNTEDFFKNIAFGASYDNTAFHLAAALQLGTQKLEDFHKALYGFNLNAVPGLILEVSGDFYNIGGEGIIDSAHFQNIGYKIIPDVFKAAVTLTEDPSAVENGPLGVSVMPWAEYVLTGTPFTLYGEVKGSTSLAEGVEPAFKWEVKVPRITYKINDAARIQFYYLLTIPAEESAEPTHKVKFNFTWYF
jgi:hypothetical protein